MVVDAGFRLPEGLLQALHAYAARALPQPAKRHANVGIVGVALAAGQPACDGGFQAGHEHDVVRLAVIAIARRFQAEGRAELGPLAGVPALLAVGALAHVAPVHHEAAVGGERRRAVVRRRVQVVAVRTVVFQHVLDVVTQVIGRAPDGLAIAAFGQATRHGVRRRGLMMPADHEPVAAGQGHVAGLAGLFVLEHSAPVGHGRRRKARQPARIQIENANHAALRLMVGPRVAQGQAIPVELLHLRGRVGRGRHELGAAQGEHDAAGILLGLEVVGADQQVQLAGAEAEGRVRQRAVADMAVVGCLVVGRP